MRSTALALVVALALLAACNGDDGATPTTPTTVAPPTTTTSAPPTTTVPLTTDGTTTTAETVETTTSTTTDPPPSTETTPTPTSVVPDDIEQVRADVAAAVVASWEAFDAVVRDPTNPEAVDALRQLMTDEEFQGVADRFVVEYVINNLAERTHPDVPARTEPYPDTLQYDPALGTASMDYCFVSTNRLVQIQPDGSEELQDDQVAVVFGTDEFVLVDGRWLDSGGSANDVRSGEMTCPGE